MAYVPVDTRYISWNKQFWKYRSVEYLDFVPNSWATKNFIYIQDLTEQSMSFDTTQ